jgi:predicted alpha/beta superfamily hydrolase
MVMRVRCVVLSTVVLLGTAGTGVEGDLRLHEFRSTVFANTRLLRVLVPSGYDAPDNAARRYPVLYLNDGQNLFDSTTSIFNPMEWRVDETVSRLVSTGRIPPLIVVGVDNAGRRGRFKEYFPYVDQYLRPPEPNPRGRDFPRFLVDEVMPFINQRYRTIADAEHTAIGGSSAGALAAIYTVVARPGVFGRLLVESPSLYVDDYHILRDADRRTVWPRRVYLGVGTNESNAPACDPQQSAAAQLARDVRRFADTLRAAGVDESRIRLVVTPCGRHDEAAWAARLPTALEFLFSAR